MHSMSNFNAEPGQHMKEVSTSKVNNKNFTLNIHISKIRKSNSELSKTHDIKKYLDPAKFSFSQQITDHIPRDTPPYLDNG